MLGGVRYRMFATTSLDYPLEPTLSLLADATGLSRDEVLGKLGAIDKKALDALLKSLGKKLDKAARLAAEGRARSARRQAHVAAPVGEGGGVMLLPPPLDPASAAAAPIIAHDAPRLARRAPKTTVAFVDLETTGLDPSRHDIIEIGIVRVDARTLEVLDEYEALVAPERSERRSSTRWRSTASRRRRREHALPLREALLEVAPLLEGALVAGHNVGFDWAFLEAGFRRAGLALPNVDYHRLDTASPRGRWSSPASCRRCRSIRWRSCSGSSARTRTVRSPMRAARSRSPDAWWSACARAGRHRAPVDERQICDALLGRLAQGRRQYGPWRLDDGRDYPSEAYAEVLDGLHYTAAELVRRRRIEAGRRRRVYVCHPFANDPAGNIERVRAISQFLIDDGALPIAPHLYLPQLIDETTGREQALALCLELLATCDEVRVFGDLVTEGMERELREAKRLGIPAHFVREVRA